MTDTNQANTSHCAAALTVLYDGPCPLYRREIAVYRGLQPLKPSSPVCFADVSHLRVIGPTYQCRSAWHDRHADDGRHAENACRI